MQRKASKSDKKTTGWEFMLWQRGSKFGYHNENVYLRDFGPISQARQLIYALEEVPEKAAKGAIILSDKDILSQCNSIIYSIEDALKPQTSSSYSWSYRSNCLQDNLVSSLYMIRVMLRLKRIVEQMQQGKSAEDAFRPYAVTDGDYEFIYPDDFLQAESEIQDSFYQTVIAAINSQKLEYISKDKFRDVWYKLSGSRHHHYSCDYRLIAEAFKYLSPYEMKEAIDYMVSSDELKNNEERGLFISAFLGSEEVLKKLGENQSYFLNAFCSHPDCGPIFLRNLTALNNLAKKLDPHSFFSLVGKWSFTPPSSATLNAGRDLFKFALMTGMDYAHISRKILPEFHVFHEQAGLVMLEALARGDITAAKSLAGASNAHQVQKRELSVKNSASLKNGGIKEIEKTVAHDQVTTYSDALSVTMQDLTAYMDAKYALAADKKDLYFISNLTSFAQTLAELGFVREPEEIIAAFNKRYNIGMTAEETDAQALKARVKKLEAENLVMRKQIDGLEEQVSLLMKMMVAPKDRVAERPATSPRKMFN